MGECGTGKAPSGDLCLSACRQKLKSAIHHGRELGQQTGRSSATQRGEASAGAQCEKKEVVSAVGSAER
jgi:hypothetical protein